MAKSKDQRSSVVIPPSVSLKCSDDAMIQQSMKMAQASIIKAGIVFRIFAFSGDGGGCVLDGLHEKNRIPVKFASSALLKLAKGSGERSASFLATHPDPVDRAEAVDRLSVQQ
jgi:hypothetical protein